MKRAYTREVLHKTKHAEVAIITWPKSAVSLPHDHGNSFGAIKVIEGAVFHDVFDKRTRKFLKHETFREGSVFHETPGIIHIMGNASKAKRAVTIHVYAPKLVMKNYPINSLHNAKKR